MGCIAQEKTDSFTGVFGNTRGHNQTKTKLDNPGDIAAAEAYELRTLVEAGLFRQALFALADAGSPETLTDEMDYVWPLKELEEKQRQWDNDRRWGSPNMPDNDTMERLTEPAAYVRRVLAEHVVAQTLDKWLPCLQGFAHMIGYRRHDVADHVICIDGVLHLFEPANVFMAGNRSYNQRMACGESAYQAAHEKRLTYVPRGVWWEVLQKENTDFTLCLGCQRGTSIRFSEAQAEDKNVWLPIPESNWNAIRAGITRRVYCYLERNPEASEQSIWDFAGQAIRSYYLSFLPTHIQQNDKPCLWYRAPCLTQDERHLVFQGTYDNRLGCQELLEQFCPTSPDSRLDEKTEREYCQALVGLVSSR